MGESERWGGNSKGRGAGRTTRKLVHYSRKCTNRRSSLTQWPPGSLAELTPLVGFLDGVEERRHVLSEASQAVGATALQILQVPRVGSDGPLEHNLLLAEGRRKRIQLKTHRV